jgi:uncharacterized protein (DUF2147 family)
MSQVISTAISGISEMALAGVTVPFVAPAIGASRHRRRWWGSGGVETRLSGTSRLARRTVYAAVLTAAAFAARPISASATDVPEGVWRANENSALRIFDCNGFLCGRVAWLKSIHDATGQIRHDGKNPDPALRKRLVCGLTVLWGLRPVGAGSWKDGWFYNPDDGKTYRAAAELHSTDTLVARIYAGLPLFGETKTLVRLPLQSSETQC